eukprot:gb/GECG01013632.1/.p1 GENE.gb/GECG01013632.1/~~gb/GECG01013632.1/.p1  ORF type:complete len:331 (+),score=73.02 gb/GECG01013632.1/:1-993(+)
MAERKVLNKYFPPDFDPAKLPKGKAPKDNQWHVRMMLPFSCRCTNCGEFMGGGKKFNSRMESIKGAEYLGLKKFRFYQKCPVCSIDFTFYTDPEISDYRAEANIVRLSDYSSAKRNEEIAEQNKQDSAPEDPMQQLEDRTQDSKRQMEIMDNLDELMEIQQAKSKVNPEEAIQRTGKRTEQSEQEEQNKNGDVLTAEDEENIRNAFSSKRQKIQRIDSSSEKQSKKGVSVKPAKASASADVSSFSSSSSSLRPSVVVRPRAKRSQDNTGNEGNSTSASSNTASSKNGDVQASACSSTDKAISNSAKSDSDSDKGGGLVAYGSSSDSEDNK